MATCLLTSMRMSMSAWSWWELLMAELRDWMNQEPDSGERKL